MMTFAFVIGSLDAGDDSESHRVPDGIIAASFVRTTHDAPHQAAYRTTPPTSLRGRYPSLWVTVLYTSQSKSQSTVELRVEDRGPSGPRIDNSVAVVCASSEWRRPTKSSRFLV